MNSKKFADWYAPVKPIVDHTEQLKNGTVLDLGAGSGRNSFYLAEQGFQVTAVEKNPDAVARLRTVAKARDLDIQIVQSDLLDYQPRRKFDWIICTMVLHFLEDDQVAAAIKTIQSLTAPGGWNLITNHSVKNKAGRRPHLFSEQELKEFYAGWEIERCQYYMSDWAYSPNTKEPGRISNVVLLARKP